MMQNKLIITIVDEKGSKQFHAHIHIKKIIFFGLMIMVGFLGGILFLMQVLMHSIDEIAFDQNIAIAEYRYIYQQNEVLKNQIQQKSHELNLIHQKIGDLENIIGIQKNNQALHHKFEEIDLQSLNLKDKKMILNLIPNGDPIKDYQKKYKAVSRERSNKKKLPLGVDYKAYQNTPVYATSDGIVEMAQLHDKKGYGHFIKLDHAFGFASLYAHLNSLEVKKGDFVKKGDLIGYSGRSGNAQESVLFYGVLFLDREIDALDFTQWGFESFDMIFSKNTLIDWKSLLWTIQDIVQLQVFTIR